MPAGPALQRAAAAVGAAVSDGIAADRPLVLEAADRRGWAPTYVASCHYADGSDNISRHSDRLTVLGPLPIVASLSLGAPRLFRQHRTQYLRPGPRSDSSGAGGGAAWDSISHVDVALPHNTLLIMWPPCQESWEHEVPGALLGFGVLLGSLRRRCRYHPAYHMIPAAGSA